MADRNGLPIRDYWQTVQKICLGTDALLQSFEQCSNSYSSVQSFRGLPTIVGKSVFASENAEADAEFSKYLGGVFLIYGKKTPSLFHNIKLSHV